MEFHSPAAKQGGKLALESGKREEADGSPRIELDQYIYIAIGSKIWSQNRTKERKPADAMAGTEFGYSLTAYFNGWSHFDPSCVH